MWATTTTTPQSFFPTPFPFPKLPQPPATTVQLRRRNCHLPLASSKDTGGLGHAVFSAIQSGPSKGSNQNKKAQQEPNKGNEISGSDILRAMQRASAKKASNKKQQKKKGSSELKKENNKGKINSNKVVDYDKVRPITIKSDWATRLADLEKRLQEFSLL